MEDEISALNNFKKLVVEYWNEYHQDFRITKFQSKVFCHCVKYWPEFFDRIDASEVFFTVEMLRACLDAPFIDGLSQMNHEFNIDKLIENFTGEEISRCRYIGIHDDVNYKLIKNDEQLHAIFAMSYFNGEKYPIKKILRNKNISDECIKFYVMKFADKYEKEFGQRDFAAMTREELIELFGPRRKYEICKCCENKIDGRRDRR